MSSWLTIGLLLFSHSLIAQNITSKKVISLMGSRFELVAISVNESTRISAIEAAIEEIKRIETLISSWNPNSETSQINVKSGITPVKVSSELINLIERTIKVSDLTNGAFDISFNSIDHVWTFDGREMEMPDPALVNSSVGKINFKNIVLNHPQQTVFLKEKGMKIGFGAIGKGYAANRAKAKMLEVGIKNGLINAGGDLIAWGNQGNGEQWRIGIADPAKEKEYIAWINISDMSVVTSGNYEKYVVIDGKKYGHIINPKTGYPVDQRVAQIMLYPQNSRDPGTSGVAKKILAVCIQNLEVMCKNLGLSPRKHIGLSGNK